MDKIERIKSLVSELNQYRNEYYNLNKPTVSDSTYDNLFDELSELEKDTGCILSNSPTQTVGYMVVSKLNKVEHSIPLLSLDKTKSIDELKKFINKRDSLLMLKADGLTCELIYEGGLLKQASTRGNSIIGEDITHNAVTFKGLPIKINWQGRLKIVGEAIIHWNDFENINSKLSTDEKYKTPRNLSSGSVRQLDSKICSNRCVCFYAFGLLDSDKEFHTKAEQFRFIESQGFNVIPYAILTYSTLVLDKSIDDMKQLAQEKFISIDGMVIAYNDLKYANSLSSTGHHPLHSIAYKFKQDAEESILRNIIWQVGRTGVITPVAEFDMIELDGTEVSRASVHNLSIMQNLELGISDKITIIKANQIIPQIEDNLTRSNNIEIPSKCPICGYKTEIQQLNESKVLMCNNPECPEKKLQQFCHFVSRDAMNIEGMSEATLEAFINKGWLKSFADIYKLSEHKLNIIRMDGFGLKSYNKLVEAINKSKTVKMENFLYSLGIPQIGKSASKTIAKYFNNDWFSFEEALCNEFDFTQLEDFGVTTNENLHKWYNNSSERHMWTELTYTVNFVKDEKKSIGLKDLTGLTFVVTGSVTIFKNRDEVGELIVSLGGKLVGSVSKNTSYLLNNDILSTSGKNQKAKELNIPVINEQQFNEMIGRVV